MKTRPAFATLINRLHVDRAAGLSPSRWTFTHEFFARLMREFDLGESTIEDPASWPETMAGLPYEVRELRYGQPFTLDADG